jgi:hypothetical protein
MEQRAVKRKKERKHILHSRLKNVRRCLDITQDWKAAATELDILEDNGA